jgi:hypothetical protein
LSEPKRKEKAKDVNFKNTSCVILLTALVFTGTSCAQQADKPTAIVEDGKIRVVEPASNEPVYLKVTGAVASGFDESPDWAPKPDPMAPFDGDIETRWASGYKDGEWIYLDFGQTKTVSKIVIKWEQAYAASFEILVSDDATSWKSVALKDGQTGGTSEVEIAPAKCRYVKLLGVARANEDWGISMWEMECYGPASENPQDTAKTSSGAQKPKEKSALEIKREELLAKIGEKVMPSPGPITTSEFQRGVNYTSWDKVELGKDFSDTSLIYLSEQNVGHIGLMVVGYQESAVSKEIYEDPKKTCSDESVAHAINICHALGMKVMLKPHVDLVDEDARLNIIPNDEWFASYKKFILKYAKLAQDNNVEIFCIATELSNTTIDKWREKWVDIINEIRNIYKGPLVYAANWDEYETVSFWPEMDYIGMDAYFPLTKKNNPPKEELVAAWKAHADVIEKWLKDKNLDKPVIFTEIGYDSVEGSNKSPWRVIPTLATHKESQQEQSDCLESLFEALSTRPWFKGFYWWNYFPRADIGTLGYTLRGKKGEAVLREWFGKLK